MKRKPEDPFMGKLMRKIAPKIGAKVVVEPEWGVVGQLTFKNGRRSYFRSNVIDINPLGASEIAKDKDYANFFLRKLGYPVIEGKTFFSDAFGKVLGSKRNNSAAVAYAKHLGFPVIAKPNSLSHGKGVHLAHNAEELKRALKDIFKLDRVALVQRFEKGDDYRVVVLDGKVISAYKRVPLSVIGDGRSSIVQLLRKKQRVFDQSGRDTKLKLNDPRVRQRLQREGFSMRSILSKGETVILLDSANLSSGGDSVDVTKTMHSSLKKLAINVTKDMGLRLCGVDLLVVGDVSKKPKRRTIIEINSAPGLDHYAQSGKAQEKVVEQMYLEVLKRMSCS
jgi:D-alanine-D-alanine ligase-like ATP-grasp enzyme